MKKLFLLFVSTILFLSACSYKVDVDLSSEEIDLKKAEIKELKHDIDNYVSQDGEIPNLMIVQLARAYEDIGEIGKAIDVYTDVLDEGYKTRAIINNLGRLYETAEEYDKAVEMYQMMIDEYFESKYLYDITWAYIRAGNRHEAEKYFNAWQLEFRKTDEHTQDAIKDLRAAEEE